MTAPTAIRMDTVPLMASLEDTGTDARLVCLISVMINPSNPAIPAEALEVEEVHMDTESRPHFPPSSQNVDLRTMTWLILDFL
jgi:hypothetical protein